MNTRDFEADRTEAQLDALRLAGADLSVPRTVHFLMLLPDEEAAADAMLRARTQGFESQVGQHVTGEWYCACVREMVLAHSALKLARLQITTIARSLAGRLDGWGFAAERDARTSHVTMRGR